VNIYILTGWSRIESDRAYIEAETMPAAIAVLRAELSALDLLDRDKLRPRAEWVAAVHPRPFCVVVWRD
jgi:hypothetical protein